MRQIFWTLLAGGLIASGSICATSVARCDDNFNRQFVWADTPRLAGDEESTLLRVGSDQVAKKFHLMGGFFSAVFSTPNNNGSDVLHSFIDGEKYKVFGLGIAAQSFSKFVEFNPERESFLNGTPGRFDFFRLFFPRLLASRVLFGGDVIWTGLSLEEHIDSNRRFSISLPVVSDDENSSSGDTASQTQSEWVANVSVDRNERPAGLPYDLLIVNRRLLYVSGVVAYNLDRLWNAFGYYLERSNRFFGLSAGNNHFAQLLVENNSLSYSGGRGNKYHDYGYPFSPLTSAILALALFTISAVLLRYSVYKSGELGGRAAIFAVIGFAPMLGAMFLFIFGVLR